MLRSAWLLLSNALPAVSTALQGVQEEANRHSGNLAVVRAVLVAGLYPNVCHIETPAEEGGKQPGSKKAAKAGRGARDRKQPPKLVVRVSRGQAGGEGE